MGLSTSYFRYYNSLNTVHLAATLHFIYTFNIVPTKFPNYVLHVFQLSTDFPILIPHYFKYINNYIKKEKWPLIEYVVDILYILSTYSIFFGCVMNWAQVLLKACVFYLTLVAPNHIVTTVFTEGAKPY